MGLEGHINEEGVFATEITTVIPSEAQEFAEKWRDKDVVFHLVLPDKGLAVEATHNDIAEKFHEINPDGSEAVFIRVREK